jgi:hypothetical protein
MIKYSNSLTYNERQRQGSLSVGEDMSVEDVAGGVDEDAGAVRGVERGQRQRLRAGHRGDGVGRSRN